MWLQDKFYIWWLHGPRYGWSKLHRKLFEGGYLNKPLPEVNSLEDIQTCMKKIDYQQDWIPQLFDCVSYPQRVWDRKKDDCEGYAVLAAELLSGWKPETSPVMVTAMIDPIGHCHSVCVFKLDGNLRYFNNWYLKPNSYQYYEDVITDFMVPSDHLVCWDVVQPATLEQLEFHVV